MVSVDHDPIALAHARNMLHVLARPSDCYYYALVARKPSLRMACG
jgi:hypothetical protein